MSAAVEQLSELELYTADEVSAMTKGAVSPYWLEKRARLEDIPARKVGRAWRWNDDDVRALFAYCRRTPKQRSRR